MVSLVGAWLTPTSARAAGQPSIQGYKRGDRELFSAAMDDPGTTSKMEVSTLQARLPERVKSCRLWTSPRSRLRRQI
jgi:hypothetical protein